MSYGITTPGGMLFSLNLLATRLRACARGAAGWQVRFEVKSMVALPRTCSRGAVGQMVEVPVIANLFLAVDLYARGGGLV